MYIYSKITVLKQAIYKGKLTCEYKEKASHYMEKYHFIYKSQLKYNIKFI